MSEASPRVALGHSLVLMLALAVALLETLPVVAVLNKSLVLMLAMITAVLETLPAVAAMATKLVIMLVVKMAASETLPAVAAMATKLVIVLVLTMVPSETLPAVAAVVAACSAAGFNSGSVGDITGGSCDGERACRQLVKQVVLEALPVVAAMAMKLVIMLVLLVVSEASPRVALGQVLVISAGSSGGTVEDITGGSCSGGQSLFFCWQWW